jgi:hypothetical protein
MASWATDEWKIERDSDLIVKKKLVIISNISLPRYYPWEEFQERKDELRTFELKPSKKRN